MWQHTGNWFLSINKDISSGTSEEQWTYQERQDIKSKLFRMAMEGKWDEAAELYEQDEWAQTAKITNSGDTALHIAVSVGKEDNVRQLIQSIWDPSRLRQVLETRNDRGNTPLHSAASMGNVAMCRCIATVYPELVGATNNNGDTPFVMAALHGEKAAFFCLHFICLSKDMDGYQFSWRKNDDTILHCAIAGDYFDLAFQIIHLYPKLARSVNQKGLTPLHLLASKPSAFRSGSHLEGYYKIIYHCILVDPLEVEASIKQPDSPGDKKKMNPETYRACNGLLQSFWRMVQGVTGKNRNGEETETKTESKGREKTDAENPEPKAGRPGNRG
ncbi:ankyrin repeat domain-containing protein 27-like [Juglans microcarpa x Juglans regia]|uniref:ankyrin repeat domain-containing protein 27-like n=1 Tax=Juglans microcarpa x Juglans regia TaxID=2249226 RepID=UPI001B7EC625|nr:ankyrin repeat domain-containing protein 27-like [Juglans microcarpa x Juglans regia]